MIVKQALMPRRAGAGRPAPVPRAQHRTHWRRIGPGPTARPGSWSSERGALKEPLRNTLYDEDLMARALVCLLLLTLGSLGGPARSTSVLWFDTEDSLKPAADDAALRIAKI